MFGILKRGGKDCAVYRKNAKSTTLLLIIKSKVHPNNVVYTGHWKSYDVLDASELVQQKNKSLEEIRKKDRLKLTGLKTFEAQQREIGNSLKV